MLFNITVLFVEIVFQAYSPLGSPDRPSFLTDPNDPVPLHEPVVLKIAEKHKGTAGQVAPFHIQFKLNCL